MKIKIVTLIIFGIMLLSSCQATSPCFVRFDNIEVETDSKYNIPDYIPIYPNSESYLADPLQTLNKPLSGTNMIEVITGTLITKSDASKVYEWYAEQAQNQGWALIDLMGFDGEVARVQAKRGEEFLEISILPDLTTTDVHIIYLVTRENNE